MALRELFEQQDCDFNCPWWVADGCGCRRCHLSSGYWKPDEMQKRLDLGLLSKKEIGPIEEMLARPQGALGDNGCELDRRHRSEDCLRSLCNPYRKVAG